VFSGIVETTARVIECRSRDGVLEISVERPAALGDLGIGDSIAIDGVCLTIERFDEARMQFALGAETLRVTGWTDEALRARPRNLERSLRFGDRVHGHLVLGHVDAISQIAAVETLGEGLRLVITTPEALRPFVWSKGSIAVNGVSLTINAVTPDTFAVGLIPETLKRTNLGHLKTGDTVTLEIDNFARGLVHLRGMA
jgi:riboflavin synthase